MIGCPVFTPYNTDNTVNYNLIKYQCDIIVRKQFDAVLIGGTTGEWIHLSINERIKLIEEWSKCVKDTNIKLIVHVSDLCIHNINVYSSCSSLCLFCVSPLLISHPSSIHGDNFKRQERV